MEMLEFVLLLLAAVLVSAVLDQVTPVSYTHLDVYKRQVHHRAYPFAHGPRFRARASIQQRAAAGKPNARSHGRGAVSYTHLPASAPAASPP